MLVIVLNANIHDVTMFMVLYKTIYLLFQDNRKQKTRHDSVLHTNIMFSYAARYSFNVGGLKQSELIFLSK